MKLQTFTMTQILCSIKINLLYSEGISFYIFRSKLYSSTWKSSWREREREGEREREREREGREGEREREKRERERELSKKRKKYCESTFSQPAGCFVI